MTPTNADSHSAVGSNGEVAFVSLLGENFNNKSLSWKGDIHSAIIDSPDDDWYPNILIENPPPQPTKFGALLFSLDQASVVSMLMSGPDRVSATKGADVVFGLGGDDVIRPGAGGDSLDGGAGDDRLIGGRGADTLLGGEGDDDIDGGPGKDTLSGGGGADNFILADRGKADRVLDFSPGEDSIVLDNAVWSGIGSKGILKASAFDLGGKASDADDRILYNADTGTLKYDANGDKAGGVTTIAHLDPSLNLGHQDFDII